MIDDQSITMAEAKHVHELTVEGRVRVNEREVAVLL